MLVYCDNFHSTRESHKASYARPSSPLATYAREKETGIKARDRRVDSTPVTEGTPGENGHTNGGGYTGGDNCMGLEKGTAKL